MSSKIIDMKNIEMTYNVNKANSVNALKNVSLSLEAGRKYAIIGPSGSGKTTLLKIMGGLLTPTKGDYFFNSENMLNASDKNLANFRNESIGFVLQDFGLLADRTVYDNVALPLLISKVKYSDIKEKVNAVLGKIGIINLSKKKIRHLSGGQIQRVAIARALVNSPQIIFADEPTGALDSVNSKMIMEVFGELMKLDITIVMVTHNPNIANQCDFIFEIEDGNIKRQ